MTEVVLKFAPQSSEVRKPRKVFPQLNVNCGPNWVRGDIRGNKNKGEKIYQRIQSIRRINVLEQENESYSLKDIHVKVRRFKWSLATQYSEMQSDVFWLKDFRSVILCHMITSCKLFKKAPVPLSYQIIICPRMRWQ